MITDSGVNCGAGGYGQNTILLRELLKQDLKNKRVLIASINDQRAHAFLTDKKIGDNVIFDLGVGEDVLSKPVKIEDVIHVIGKQVYGFGQEYMVGEAYTVCLLQTSIDVIILDHNVPYETMKQFHHAGLEFHDYDIVVVKMGYLYTYLILETAYHMMALTDEATIQCSKNIPFKKNDVAYG